MVAGPPAWLSRRETLVGLSTLFFAREAAPTGNDAVALRTLLDRAAVRAEPAQILAVLRRAPVHGLEQADWIRLRMVMRGLEREIDLRARFPFGKSDGSSPYVLSQRHGAYLQLGEAAADPARQARRLDSETARLRAEAARGILPPDFILDALLSAQQELAAAAAPPVRDALVRQIEALRELRGAASSAPGVWRLAGGEDEYRLRLRCATGLDRSPEQIERRVAEETAALLSRADRLLEGLGLAGGSVGERLRALKDRPEHRFPNDETGRARAVAAMNAALDRIRPRLESWFGNPWESESSVRRMSAADERAGRRGYRVSPKSGVPGVYYPDLSAVHERPAWTLTTVTFHETIPGHLIQLGREAQSDAPHPLQVKYAPGYSEGWAIYAETLVDDAGLLSPVEQLGFIQSMLFRLARVACDIGIHVGRWDRTRALRYLEDNVGFELFFPFAVEVDRYAAEPAAFAGDVVTALTLRRLGRDAEAIFAGNIRVLHNVALNLGPLSADAIERSYRDAFNYPCAC